MTIIIIALIIVFIYAIYLSYRNDIKLKHAKYSDFYKPFLLGIIIFFALRISNGIQNYFIDQEKYLTQFNIERTKFDLQPFENNNAENYKLFKDWKSYFGDVKKNYCLEIIPIMKNRTHFIKKYIVVNDKLITYEEDTYRKDNISIQIEHYYLEKETKYSFYEYEIEKDGKEYSKEKITLNRQQCLDTLNNWKTSKN
jgi:hypothetical protein